MPGGSKKGGGLKTKKSSFYLKSGNSPLFKMMGSSPVKQESEEGAHEERDHVIGEYYPTSDIPELPLSGEVKEIPDIEEVSPIEKRSPAKHGAKGIAGFASMLNPNTLGGGASAGSFPQPTPVYKKSPTKKAAPPPIEQPTTQRAQYTKARQKRAFGMSDREGAKLLRTSTWKYNRMKRDYERRQGASTSRQKPNVKPKKNILQQIFTKKSTTKGPSKKSSNIVTTHDKAWDYKKDGDVYLTKKKGSDKWITPSSEIQESIRKTVFEK